MSDRIVRVGTRLRAEVMLKLSDTASKSVLHKKREKFQSFYFLLKGCLFLSCK